MKECGRPNWKTAPPWANWLAMDSDGVWWWYEKEPRQEQEQGMFKIKDGPRTKFEVARFRRPGWDSTLEERPEDV